MAYKRKYRKGEKITSLDELAKQKFIYFHDKIIHGGWACAWQISLAKRYIDNGWLYYAQRIEDNEGRQEADIKAFKTLKAENARYEGENNTRIDKWMNLVFEEAKIRAKREYDKRCEECIYNEVDMFKLIAEAKSEAIIKMHSLIKERCIAGGIYPAFVSSTIEKVAKELLGE